MTDFGEVIGTSELEGPYPPRKYPGWIAGFAWAYTMWRHKASNACVMRCRYCDHAIRFPTFPDTEDQTNGVIWMMVHNYRHVVMGDVDPDDLAEPMGTYPP